MSRARRHFVALSGWVLLIQIGAGAWLEAQDPPPRFLPAALSGLSHNIVNAMAQDREGFLWLGTWDGLDRYDGYRILSFHHDPEDPTSLSHNYVSALFLDREGRLWVGTELGLNRFVPESQSFARYLLDPAAARGDGSTIIWAIHETDGGQLWVGSGSGLHRFEGTRRIRALAPSSRVIMLTVHEESESIYQALCAGASGYLLKPSGAEAILDAIRQVAQGAAPINGYIARKLLDMFSQLAHPEGGQPDYRLTSREREVLRLLVDGLILKQIAARLDVSYHTVDTHVRNIYDKLHVNSRGGAVAKAIKERLVSLSERTGSSQAGPGRGVRRTGGGA